MEDLTSLWIFMIKDGYISILFMMLNNAMTLSNACQLQLILFKNNQ